MALVDKALQQAIADFNARGQLGPDPVGALYAERRKSYSYFTRQMSDADCEALRPYLFCWSDTRIPQKAGDPAPTVRNFIAGEWRAPLSGEHAAMASLADRRVTLFQVPASGKKDVSEWLYGG